MLNITINDLVIALVFLVLFQILLLSVLIVYFIRRGKIKNDSSAETNYFMKRAKLRSDRVIHSAIQDANQILANAELEGIKLFAKQKFDSGKAGQEYGNRLNEIVDQTIKQLDASNNKFFVGLIDSLGKKIEENVNQHQDQIDKKALEFIDITQQKIDEFVNDVHQRVKEQLGNELQATQDAVKEYRRQRMAAVDQNILEIVEKTIIRTLGKQLPVSDQSDLVFAALEEAKKEGFFEG